MNKDHQYMTDGVLIRESFIDAQGELHGRLHQPSRTMILERNAELRRSPGVLKKDENLDRGLELTIPVMDLYYLKKQYPELDSSDSMVRTLAWSKFMASSESDPYRVRDRETIRKN